MRTSVPATTAIDLSQNDTERMSQSPSPLLGREQDVAAQDGRRDAGALLGQHSPLKREIATVFVTCEAKHSRLSNAVTGN